MWNTLVEYLQYPFVRRILVAGVLVAFCASMLGVTLVLKRFSYIETDCPMWHLQRWQSQWCCE